MRMVDLIHPGASAPQAPQQSRPVQVLDLGEGVGLIGLQLEPIKTEGGDFTVGVMVIGGPMSDLVPMTPRKVLLGTALTTPIENVRALLRGEKPEEVKP